MRTTLARFALLATLLCTSNLARADDRGAAAGAVVGGVAGALLGGPIGAAIGAGIGTVAGGAVTSPAAMQMVLPAQEAEAPVVQLRSRASGDAPEKVRASGGAHP